MKTQFLITVFAIVLLASFTIGCSKSASDASSAPPPTKDLGVAEVYGIGVALAKHPGGFIVTKVLTNSPVAVDGAIAEGDLITAVAESNARPVSLESLEFIEDAVAMIRGPKGTVVRLTVVPSVTNIARTKVVSLVRGELRGVAFGGIWLSLTNGAKAPDVEFQRLPDKGSEKGSERLSEYLGKVVVLEFWATWCGPCLRAMPGVQNQAKRFAARKDVVWITASVDEGPDIAATDLKANGWKETLNLWADKPVVAAFGIHSIPRMFIINPQGRITYQGDALDAEELSRLLAEK